MLNAFLGSKAGTTQVAISAGTSWRTALKSSEDMLTAAVFERLSYLPGADLWGVLQAAFPDLPPYRVAELKGITFWPRWEDVERGEGQVEPDVIMDFGLGDPQRQVTLVIEAKTGGSQSACQLKRQWAAAQEQEDISHPILVLVGGLGRNALPALRRELGIQPKDMVGANWPNLAKALKQAPRTMNEMVRILDDSLAALASWGYRYIDLTPPTLTLKRHAPVNDVLATLKLSNE